MHKNSHFYCLLLVTHKLSNTVYVFPILPVAASLQPPPELYIPLTLNKVRGCRTPCSNVEDHHPYSTHPL